MGEEKEMDGDIMRWTLEFLLRECTNSNLIARMLSNFRLPFPAGDDSRFKKTTILRSIQDEIGKGSVSEEILELLEAVEEIDRRDGSVASELMKHAYCAVAVECTARHRFEEAIGRIWKGRIQRLVGKSELVTGEVPKLRFEVENAIRDMNSHRFVLKWREEHNALQLVQDYLTEAFEIMGPSFLQVAARLQMEKESHAQSSDPKENHSHCRLDGTVITEEHLCDDVGIVAKGSLDVDDSKPHGENSLKRKKRRDRDSSIAECSNGKVAGTVTGEEQICDESGCEPMELQEAGGRPGVEDTKKKRKVVDKRKHVSRCHGPAKIADVGEIDDTGDLSVESRDRENVGASASATNDHGVSVDQGRTDLGLPQKEISTSLAGKLAGNQEPPLDKHNAKDVDAETAQTAANDAVASASAAGDQEPPLDKHNAKDVDAQAAQTAANDAVASASAAENRPHGEIHSRLPVSPLKNYEDLNLLRRRKKRKWSSEEETALINGVQQFGVGSWKDILNFRRDQFDNRSEVDLKDKWRNLNKYIR